MSVNPLNGPIVQLLREREEDHRHDTLALWEQRAKATSPSLPWSRVDKLSLNDLNSIGQNATQVIISCSLQAPDLVKDLLTKVGQQSDTRFYLLAPLACQNDDWLKKLVAKLPPNLLTRLGLEPPGDWLVANGSTGRLFLGAPGQARRWALHLDKEGAQSLFQAFSWMFWHRSTLEAIPGATPGGFQRCLSAPWPEPSATVIPLARGVLHARNDMLPMLPFPELVVSPDGLPWPGNPASVLAPPTQTPFELLRDQSARGASIAWTSLDLPRLSLTRQRLALSLEEGPLRLQLECESQDAIALRHSLEDIVRQPEWCFYPERKLMDVQGPIWMEGARAAVSVDDRHVRRLGTLQADNLDNMQLLQPMQWPPPEKPSRLWRFTWEVEPPRVPSGAREARLVQDWRRLDEYVVAQGEALRRQLKGMEEEETKSGLLTRLVGLVKPWDSVKRKRQQIADQLDEILEDKVSRRPTEAADLLSRLRTQQEAMRTLRSEARAAEEREELRLVEEKQRAQYEAERKGKQSQLEVLEARLQTVKASQQEKTTEKEQAALALAHEEQLWTERQEAEQKERSAASESERQALEAKQSALKETVRTLRNQLSKAKKDKKKALGKDLEQTNSELSQLAGLLAALKAPPIEMSTPPAEILALREKIGGLEKELKDLLAQATELGRQHDTLHNDLRRDFVFKAPASNRQPLKLEAPPAPPSIPTESLPESGRLLEHNNMRFLEVTTWETAERLRKAAERLSAKRVAPASGHP